MFRDMEFKCGGCISDNIGAFNVSTPLGEGECISSTRFGCMHVNMFPFPTRDFLAP